MRVRQIRQAVSEDSLFRVLSEWCINGAGHSKWRLRIISAFVSGEAIRALEPLVDVFLADGNVVEIIFGVDRNGTDRFAVRRLFALATAYPGQVIVSLFHAPSRSSIFHPKLYILTNEKALSGVVGSANLTLSGLGSNLESLVLYEEFKLADQLPRVLMSIWETFANPKPPLRDQFLRKLDRTLASQLVAKLPKRSREETASKSNGAGLWEPLSRVKLPRSQKIGGRIPVPRSTKAYMIYEIMTETRSTQMQIPLSVVEDFCGVPRDEPAESEVSIITGGSLSQPILRPVVISQGNEGKRLMRRLEMPTIRQLERNLVAVFIKLANRNGFAYKLCPRDSKWYQTANSLLAAHGQQGNAERRYYIGEPGDGLWARTNAFLGLRKLRQGGVDL